MLIFRLLFALMLTFSILPGIAAAGPQVFMPDEDPYYTPYDQRACLSLGSDAYAVMGLRYDNGFTICIPVLSTYFEVKNIFVSAPRSGGQLPARQWPSGADESLRVPGYTGPSMHWCGPNAYMTAYDVPNNTFTCVEIGKELPFARNPSPDPNWQPLSEVYVDGPGGTQALYPVPVDGTPTHVCRDGYVLMGMHQDANIFLCGLLFFNDS